MKRSIVALPLALFALAPVAAAGSPGASASAAASAAPSSAAVASPAGPGDACREAITKENAERLFATLKELHADGCALEEVRTDRAVMHLEWRKAGTLLPKVVIVPTSCAPSGAVRGQSLAASVPAELSAACPEAAAKIVDALGRETVGELAKVSGPAPASPAPHASLAVMGGGAAALVGALAAFFLWRRRRSAPPAPPETPKNTA